MYLKFEWLKFVLKKLFRIFSSRNDYTTKSQESKDPEDEINKLIQVIKRYIMAQKKKCWR